MLNAGLSLPRRTAAEWASRQARVGLCLAAAIAIGWLVLHVSGLFLLPLRGWWWALAPLVVALQCWCSVGLFIVSHDAMHGSLAPGRPAMNRGVGRVALMLYGGIWYDQLVDRHFAHHRLSGTVDDPDFHGDGTAGALRWFVAFFREYLSAGQLLRQTAVATVYVFLLGVPYERLLIFWAAPALLSAVQLFYFGTYLPHRAEADGFVDTHRARSNDFSYLVSLATCFHFGYHHEHHTDPSVPWWRLPARRAGAAGR